MAVHRGLQRPEPIDRPEHLHGLAVGAFGLGDEEAPVEEAVLIQIRRELPDRHAADEVRKPRLLLRRPFGSFTCGLGHVTTLAFIRIIEFCVTFARKLAGALMRAPWGSAPGSRSWNFESKRPTWSTLSNARRESSLVMSAARSGDVSRRALSSMPRSIANA